jgi:hypothetical protein
MRPVTVAGPGHMVRDASHLARFTEAMPAIATLLTMRIEGRVRGIARVEAEINRAAAPCASA